MSQKLEARAVELAEWLKTIGINAEPGLGGSVTIYASGPEGETLLACYGLTSATGEPAPRGDSGLGTPDLAELITDLALVLRSAATYGLPALHRHALERLQSALGWPEGASREEIAGRLAVTMAKAQAQGEPAPRGDSDPVRQAACGPGGLRDQAHNWMRRYLNADWNPGNCDFDTEDALEEAWLAGAGAPQMVRLRPGPLTQGEPAPRGDSDPVRQAAEALTADMLRIFTEPPEDLSRLGDEIQEVAKIWIESACMAREPTSGIRYQQSQEDETLYPYTHTDRF